ncbi:MAG TPA: sialidase family protein, partial [Polyangiaceae bacterium]
MTPRKMGARFQAVVLSSMPAALFVAACSVAGDQESVGQTQEAIVGSSNVPALSSDYILTTQGAGENTLKVIPSRRNSACQDGAVVMSLGSSKQLMTRPLFENNWATLDTTTNGVPFAFPGVTSQEAMTSTDNQIVRMRDGSLLAAHITKTWAPVSPPPPYASLPVYYNGAQYQSGTRNELLLSRSTDCGATWQRWGSIDSALVAGGIYGWPQPYCNPGTGLSCQWTDPATGLLTFWVGGWDRPEVYADPWSPWVYVSLDGDGGPYNPSPGNGANYHAGLVLASSTGGTSWQLLGTLPEGTPFAMTTTPNKRFYAFSCPAGVPTLYYTTDPNNPGTLNGGVSLQTIDPSLPSCVNGFNGLDINANLQSYTIGRVSKDTFSSVVRIVYPMTNGYGTQSLETAYVSVSDANPSNPPIVTVATTIDAAGPALNSTVFPTIVEPDYVDTPAGFQTDRSLLYWLESSGTNGGQPDLSPQFCARFYVLGSGIRNPGPYSLTRSNGTPVCWSVSPGNGIGDYMTGGFFWDKRRLNFLAQWLETDGAIHANLVRVSPHARTLQQLGLPGDVNGDGMADLVATGYSQGQWVFIKGHRVWTQT